MVGVQVHQGPHGVSPHGELGDTADEQLLAMCGALREWFEAPDFRGCAFLNASAEYSGGDVEIRSLVAAHKHRIEEFVRAEAAAGDYQDPGGVAASLLLMEGATVTAQWAGSSAAARAVAVSLLEAVAPRR